MKPWERRAEEDGMKESPIGIVVVVVIIAGVLWIALMGFRLLSTAATEVAQEGVRTQENEALRRTAESEEIFDEAGPVDAEADLAHLSLEVLAPREGAPTPRLTLLWAEDSRVAIRFDTQTDEVVLETAAGQTHALDLAGFFELEEMRLNPGERSLFVSLSPSRVAELGAVRAVFRRHSAQEEAFEVGVALDIE